MNVTRRLLTVLGVTVAAVVVIYGLALVAFIILMAAGMSNFGSNK